MLQPTTNGDNCSPPAERLIVDSLISLVCCTFSVLGLDNVQLTLKADDRGSGGRRRREAGTREWGEAGEGSWLEGVGGGGYEGVGGGGGGKLARGQRAPRQQRVTCTNVKVTTKRW